MSKPKPYIVSKTPSAAPSKPLLARHMPTAASIRETIESIAIAFILAFLFRTFEAEAFVIPTGSMAPTLMGRHKDLKCEKCGYPVQVSASEEVDHEGQIVPREVVGCTCPMCRHTMGIDGRNPQSSYSGDRIIVNKFSYALDDPKRWDVIVFYYPEGAHDNFIKRLAALPDETIRIRFGDVWIRSDKDTPEESGGQREFHLARKPPDKLLAMLQPVFDNDYMPDITKYGWPARWQADPRASNTAVAWNSDDFVEYKTDGDAASEVWLRYRHLVPSFTQWNDAGATGRSPQIPVKPQLITDFTAYNTGFVRATSDTMLVPTADTLGLHWVGDLAVSTTADIENNAGEVVLELVKGGRQFQCRIDVSTGQATLSISGEDMQKFHRTAQTNVRGPGKYRLMFSNCDRELLLWVDDRVVKFDSDTTYDDLNNTRPTPLDLTPVGIASRGARMKLNHLKVMRDIYYIAVDKGSFTLDYMNNRMNFLSDYKKLPILLSRGRSEQFFSDPTQWSDLEESNMRQVEFPLKAGQYFALGDNSAKSRDSRLWISQYWIDRDLLKGKALFIYWPHSWNRIPYVNIPFPFFPNFSRMHFIK
jgi:signal peptidase I